ncbi:MAG: ATP-dependent DNA helicase [Candidatus Hadarchaeales archaeon]
MREVCERYSLPQETAEILESRGIIELYPPQQEAIEKGAMSGKNLVLAVATAAGKTLVAELCMLKSVLMGGKCIYIVPLRALASEKYEDFKEKYSRLGIKVGISTGDYDAVDPRLASYDILVATSEKVDSLLRHTAKWLADVVSVVVLDEVHLIEDPGRGPTLEVLTARLRQVNPDIQILALSATIKNADEIAEWLKAELVTSDWRPVPLKKGVYWKGEIIYSDESRHKVDVEAGDPLTSLAFETVNDGGQVLVFVNTRKAAQSAASSISEYIWTGLSEEERKILAGAASEIEKTLGEPTQTCRELAACVKKGAAFHHAGLHHAQRKIVEDLFRKNALKVVCATPTLAMGLNLPSRRTIIRDCRRYVEPYGMTFIPVLEFHQLCGRAGRPQYDRYGEAVVIAHGRAEVNALFEEFINAEPERIISKLATEPAMRSHVLASVAAGYVRTEEDLMEFLGQTFFAFQFGISNAAHVVHNVLDFMEREDMIRREGRTLTATRFGELVSKLYIDPLSGVILRDGLKNIGTEKPGDIGLLHLICHTPDMPPLYLREKDYPDAEAAYFTLADQLLTPIPDAEREPEKFEIFLAELKTAQMLQMWIEEVREDMIHERFGVGAGDIRRAADTAEWLLYSAHEIAGLFRCRSAITPLRNLRERVRHGVKEELLELVSLRGIGRVRGRSLYRAGYRSLKDIARASEEELAKVPYIGTEIARSIMKQTGRNTALKPE